MLYGDIQGKGRVYTNSGNIILKPGEKILKSTSGVLHRGWIKYKLGWRTILFKGFGCFNFTNQRIIYLEVPAYIEKIHTFSLDHELGDFGGWDYHAHSMRRAAALGAFMFFELPYSEVIKFKHGKKLSTVLTDDKKHKYKLVIEHRIAKELERHWKNKKG